MARKFLFMTFFDRLCGVQQYIQVILREEGNLPQK
jgi:hypothetical protein